MDQYAVFGHPISHSKSPRIHALFAEQTGQELEYTAWDVPAATFRTHLNRFRESGGRGLNCTLPLKELAFACADTISERAALAAAVNTLSLQQDGRWYGDNTDGIGLVRDLTVNLGIAIRDRRVLVLGAGGAVRGILGPLLAERPGRLAIANRTAHKAAELADQFQRLGPVTGGGIGDVAKERFDLILNATAASLSGQTPHLPDGILAPGGTCYDLAYGEKPTPFVLLGRELGATLSADGLGMLVEQAAEAFSLWRGVRPATGPVIALLEAERGNGRTAVR